MCPIGVDLRAAPRPAHSSGNDTSANSVDLIVTPDGVIECGRRVGPLASIRVISVWTKIMALPVLAARNR